MPIKVVNKYKHTPTDLDIYIGRGSVLGNPYTSIKDLSKTKAKYQCESREESIAKFKEYLNAELGNDNMDMLSAINEICELAKGQETVHLVCFCKPQDCHGDVIKDLCDQIVELRKG